MNFRRLFLAGLLAPLLVGCRPQPTDTEEPAVNTPRPNPLVKDTNRAGVALTNFPVERSSSDQ